MSCPAQTTPGSIASRTLRKIGWHSRPSMCAMGIFVACSSVGLDGPAVSPSSCNFRLPNFFNLRAERKKRVSKKTFHDRLTVYTMSGSIIKRGKVYGRFCRITKPYEPAALGHHCCYSGGSQQNANGALWIPLASSPGREVA